MNFSQLQSFVALVDTGSFTEAAYSIDLTQSAVSHALAAELGVTLLERVVALSLDPPQPLQIGLAVRSQAMASPGAKLFIQTALAWAQEQAPLPLRVR